VDGTVSEEGDWVLWEDPARTFPRPGLNCSGFLLSAARLLLRRNFSLDTARRDILQDSGPGAPLGRDWDFGLDVALNLAGPGAPVIPWPGGPGVERDGRGRALGWGVDIHSEGLQRALGALRPGAVHFFAISKPDRRFPSGLSYYHNGILLPLGGRALLYHATRRAGVHRLDLSRQDSLARFRANFPGVGGRGERRMVFVGAQRPPCFPEAPERSPGGPRGKPALAF
jgi:hypothetical protein